MSLLLLKRAWKSNFFRSHEENCTKGLILSNVYSYFEKGRRKKCTRQSRIVLWVVFSSLFFKEIWKNGKMVHGYMSASAEVGSKAAVWLQYIDHIPYCLSGLSRAHFSDNLARNTVKFRNRTWHTEVNLVEEKSSGYYSRLLCWVPMKWKVGK